MPEITRFYGMIIRMYFQQSEHNPPHFHVAYGERVGEIEISTGKLLKGNLPAKAVAIVNEWLDLHRDELKTMWETQEFKTLPPLD